MTTHQIYLDRYAVSKCGEVINLTTKKLVKPYVHKSRNIFYLRINLNSKKIFIHTLVFMLWKLPDLPSLKFKYQIDHKDGNPFNCHIDNLDLVPAGINQAKKRKRRIQL